MKKRVHEGFTLIELLIVVAIIGIVASIVLVSMNGARKSARDSRRLSEMNQIKKGIELYRAGNGEYPTCAGNSVCSSTGYGGDIKTLLPGSEIFDDPMNQDGVYGYYYARGYRKTGVNTWVSTGTDLDHFVIGMRLEAQNGTIYSGWNNNLLNWLEGS